MDSELPSSSKPVAKMSTCDIMKNSASATPEPSPTSEPIANISSCDMENLAAATPEPSSKPVTKTSGCGVIENSATATPEPSSTLEGFVPGKMDLKSQKDGGRQQQWTLGRIRHFNHDLAHLVYPGDDLDKLRPNLPSIISVMFIFIVFAILLAVAARLPVVAMRWILVSFGCATFFWAAFILRKEWWERRQGLYRTNLGNTALTVLITIPLFTVLYTFLWYGSLRDETLVTTMDTVSSIRYPSVALFQRNDYSAQAELLGTDSKCFLGWYDPTARSCSSLTPEEYANGINCKCQDLWDTMVTENFTWQGTSFSYLAFKAPDWLLDYVPTHIMLLQAYFNFNGSAASTVSAVPENPSLMMAIYDPELGLQASFDAGYTRMVFIGANGIVSVNANLRTRQTPGHPLAYDYDVSISSSPTTNIVCDISKPGSRPCLLSLLIQIPSFQRENVRIQKVMKWLDVAASAAAYFSFVQFLSWVLSLQAFST